MGASHVVRALAAGALAVLAAALPVQAQYDDPLSPAERDHATSHGPFRVVLGPTGAPFAFAENGIHRGLAIDILRLISVELGVEFKTKLVDDFGHAYDELLSGEAEVYGPAVPDPGRLHAVAYTEPFAWPRFGFWVGPSMAFAQAPADLAGHRVAVANSTLHLQVLAEEFPEVIPVAVNNSLVASQMLAAGEVDGMYGDHAGMAYYLRQNDGLSLRPLGEPLRTSEAAWAVRSSDPLLRSILSKGLQAIDQAEREALYLKWTGLELDTIPSHDSSPVLVWVVGATTTSAVLLVVHSSLLRRQVQSRTRQLRAERDKFVRIMETNPGPVLVVDSSGHIIYANGRAELMLRLHSPTPGVWEPPEWEMDDLEGHPLPDDQTPFARVLATRQPLHGQRLRVRWADGYVLPVSCNAAPLLGVDGEIIAMVLALEDLQDHLAAEQAQRKDIERRAEVRRLREIDAFRTEFMNAAAHEIKTPLTPLSLQLHLIDSDPAGMSPRQRHAVKVLRRNLERLSQIAHDMLDITRIDSGQLAIQPRPMDLAALASQATDAVAFMSQEHGVDLSLEAPDQVLLEADPERLMQVMEHLLSNAIKFTPQGGTVRVTVRAEAGEALVEVTDSGIGLSQEQQERLFMPFARLHTDRHEAPGTGLGLHVSKRIVEAHGGRIGCHSEGADKGATFTVCLPRSVAVPAVTVPA